jgi:hypothetical protein
MCLAYVALLMVLPLFELDCGVTTFEWTGAQLVTGSSEPLTNLMDGLQREFGSAAESMGGGAADNGEGAGDELPSDWALLALPGLAGLGIIALLADRRVVSTALIALLLGAFTWFTAGGFRLEREMEERIAAKVAREGVASLEDLGEGLRVETHKLPAFWIGFGATGLALLLVAGDKPRRRRR